MNLNPFVFSYNRYPNRNLATAVSKFCGGIQRMFIIFAIGIILVVVFDDVSNWDEALVGATIMLVLWLILKLNKNKWTDKIAAKQEIIDNSDNTKEI